LTAKKDTLANNNYPWINPIGGFGDQLMLSGVLKQVIEQFPSKRFNLARRTNYLTFLKRHPAIAEVGFPPKDSEIIGVDYWSMEKLGPGNQRPFQILARRFGLTTPVEEHLYIPDPIEDDPLLYDIIPWKKRNIVIAPASDSPRKVIHPSIWHRAVQMLRSDGSLVLQVGRLGDLHIRNAYSLLGLTTPRQLFSLISRCDLVITSDNFIMHAAHLMGAPAVAIWGPTHHRVYGYPEQTHLQMPKTCELGEDEECIGPHVNRKGKLYNTPCPHKDRHCMDKIRPVDIYKTAKKVLMGI